MSIDVLLARKPWECSDSDALARVAALEHARRILDSHLLAAIREIDRRGLALSQGATGTKAWLRATLAMDPGRASALTDTARRVETTFPRAGEALAAGEMSLDHVQAVTRSLAAVAAEVEPAALAEAEVFLVGHAQALDPRQLARAGRDLACRLGPDATERMAGDEARAVEKRELWISECPLSGMWSLRGELDPLTGAALRAEIDARSAPLPAQGAGPDLRSAARRRADAFAELLDDARRRADTQPGPGARSAVQLVVSTTLAVLEGRAQGGGRTAEGTMLSPGIVRRLACDAQVVPVVLGAASEPLDVGRASYVVPTPMRRALSLRDGGCPAPGCDRPPGWCDAHHAIPWARGGTTALSNLALACGHHHAFAHSAGWDVTLADDGVPEWRPPAWIDPHRAPRRHARFSLPVAEFAR